MFEKLGMHTLHFVAQGGYGDLYRRYADPFRIRGVAPFRRGPGIDSEPGTVLTALMMIGRAGSMICAGIGVMRNSEQIDSLESMVSILGKRGRVSAGRAVKSKRRSRPSAWRSW